MPPKKPYPLAHKITRDADRFTALMLQAVGKRKREIAHLIRETAIRANAATDAAVRDRLFAKINSEYAALAGDIDRQLKKLTEEAAGITNTAAVEESDGRLTKFSEKRLRDYWGYVSPKNAPALAAVYTERMSLEEIGQLRQAFLEVQREASVSGLTHNEVQKALQTRWDALAGNEKADRFVDRGGKVWENARYLQMLTLTTAMRVSNEAYIDSLVESGFSLARISDDSGHPCGICSAWEGQIVCIAGESKDFPSVADAEAAGVWHPNCTHRLEYIDPNDEAGEVARQKAMGKPGKEQMADEEAMQERQKERETQRHMAEDGESRKEAERHTALDHLEKELRHGLFSDGLSKAVANATSPEDLDTLYKGHLPHIDYAKKGEKPGFRNSKHGGVLRVPRGASAEEIASSIKLAAGRMRGEKDPEKAGRESRRKGVIAAAKERVKERLEKSRETRAEKEKAKEEERQYKAALGDLKTQAQIAGYSPEMIASFNRFPRSAVMDLKDIKYGRTTDRGNPAYYMAGKIKINPRNSWTNNPITLAHESGHAIIEKRGLVKIGKYVDPDLKTAIEAQRSKTEALLRKVFKNNWDFLSKNTPSNDYQIKGRIAKKIFGVSNLLDADIETQKRVSRFCDMIAATTNGEYGRGHEKKYFEARKGFGEPHEIAAHTFSDVVKQDPVLQKHFGDILDVFRDKMGLDKISEKK